MSKKISVSKNSPKVETRFATWIKMVIDLIAPKFLWFIAGRATAKTTDIIAERSMDICHDMPGAYFAFVADTYVNAAKNVVPTLIDGWKRKGWREGIHFVVDKPPPAHFKKPYKAPQTYKHTISIYNGCFFNIVSMDQPSGAAGNSYQHLFGDEAKYLEFAKLKKLTPALRGYTEFAHSVYYRGSTFTTDMPNVADGEYDWILDREKDMDPEQIKLALEVAFVLNDIRKEMYHAMNMPNGTEFERKAREAEIKRVDRLLSRWEERSKKIRKNSTFFYVVSSFVNVDVLSEGYFEDSLLALGIEEFKTAICSFKSTLKKGERFYTALGDHHFVEGINTKYYERFPIGDPRLRETSLASLLINHNAPIDGGVDFGDMLSIVCGQEHGDEVRLFKNFYTLPPDSSKEIAEKFLDYFRDHKHKVFNMYYDRSGNQNSKIKKDWASELQEHIENLDGKKTGWKVNLMSRGQATILHEEEYNLMRALFGRTNPELPSVVICKYGCRELKSSMEMAKTKIKVDPNGKKTIHKDKSSESIAYAKRPLQSTNMSDAGKYFFAREKWMKLSFRRRSKKLSAPDSLSGLDKINHLHR